MGTPTVRVYRHGLSGGVTGSHRRASTIRGECSGWSLASSRSNTRFLWSVRQDELTGVGVAFTLTVRDCPDSHADWRKVREAFVARQRRRGLVRLHWLTEMQARGVPHLHGVAFFDPDSIDCLPGQLHLVVQMDWIDLASRFGTNKAGQDGKPVTSVLGWLEYLAKHAARGVGHYQRCRETLPPQWQGRTGRMWGHVGEWPVDEPVGLSIDYAGFYRLRRLHRAYRLAKARALPSATPKQAQRRLRALRASRQCLRCVDAQVARFRGVSGWVPAEVSLRMVALLVSQGCQVDVVDV